MTIGGTLNEIQIILVNPYTKDKVKEEHLNSIEGIYRKAREFCIENISIRNLDEIDDSLAGKIISIAENMYLTTTIKGNAIRDPKGKIKYGLVEKCSDCYAQERNGHIERLNVLYDGHPMFCGKIVNAGVSGMYIFQELNKRRLDDLLSDWNFTRYFFDKEECMRCI